MKNRVVVTGMGAISSAGTTVESFTESLRLGRPGFSNLSDPRIAHLTAQKAGIVIDFDELEIARRFNVFGLDRFHLLALEAAQQALKQADILCQKHALRIGVIFGTCSGPMLSIEKRHERVLAEGADISDSELFATRYEGAAHILARAFGISGISATVVTACSASLGAIGIAADLIRMGALDAALVGGADTLSPTTIAGFDGLKATCETNCAPFSKPLGLSLGEAGACLVLEERDHARERNASIFAEIAGFGSSNDAFHCTSPDPSGAGQALAMERALADSALDPASIIYINAHGTGTAANDKTETKAVIKVFGALGQSPPISSTKSIVGHCLGAAGCLEVIASIACMRENIYPSTAGFSVAREGCSLDYLPDAARPCTKPGPIMSNNFAFGGNNASLVLWPGISGPDAASPERGASEDIVITGCGIVSPAGVGAETFISALTKSDQMTCKTARVELPDIRSIDRRLDVHGMDKSGVLAACAARLALLEADVGGRASLRTDIGLFLHLASGSTAAEWEHIGVLLSNKFHLSQLTAFPYVVPNSITGNVCKALGLTGHNSTLCFGPGAGLLGLGISWNAMKSGHAHMLLSGSVDELLPFDKKYGLSRLRGGFENHIPGEGACMFMLETHSSAKQRGAPILGTICSFTYATESNASVSSKESAALLEHVVSQALIDAEILPKDIYAVSFSFNEPHQKQALDSALGHCRYKTYDVSGFLGNAAATLSSFNLAYCLLDSSIDTSGSKKYILSVLSSEGGARCAAIFAK